MKVMFCRAIVVCSILLSCVSGFAQDQESESQIAKEKTSITAAIDAYVGAFNSKDAEKLAALWSNDGVYASRDSEEQTVGRAAIEENLKQLFASGESPKLAVETESLELVSPNVALERGTATVTHSDEDTVQTRYSVVYVKQDGKWLIDRVTEEEIVIEENHYDELKALEFLIGQWNMEGEGFRVEFNCQWTTKQNFISRTYKVYGEEDEVESSGLEVIGWDAKEKKIRSWLFDSDGGVVRGTWHQRDDGWATHCVATLADGGAGSYLCILRPQEDGNFSWEKINRFLDGKLLPNVDETVLQRQ